MTGDLKDKLAAALRIEVKPVCEVQRLYNEHKKFLSGKVIKTPLPEHVHLLDENFPYWIHLENQDPVRNGAWISTKANVVLSDLEAGIFDQNGFRFDAQRARSLSYLPVLLRNPHCIHVNLRHHDERGDGGIRGHYMYVEYHHKKTRKVAFTLRDDRIGKIIVVSSFWTYKKWVQECAESPAVYVRNGCECTCCG
ncbi:MAG TPA: hypothetical protein VFP59_18245 [Candidatus Angelobacter sp.]|nr:hypothetical protein [Candidatus Angelobacter sp.]